MTPFHTAVVYSVFLSLAYLSAMAAAAVISAVRHGGRREEPPDDPKALSASRFTAPVSLIVPVGRDSRALEVSTTVTALLDLHYPELEVIVVAEKVQEIVWSALKTEWALEAREFFYRQSLPTRPVHKIYRSARDPRLMIVDKTPGTRADALNSGVNLARFRYVSAVDVGVSFDANALLRAMAAPLRDPAAVVAASSHLEVRDAAGVGVHLGGTLQHLESIRSMMESRLAWRTLDAGFGPETGVVVWRRTALVQAGGFSTSAADPDLDMMVRLQTSSAPGIDGRVVRSAEIFGRIDPRSFIATARLTARRQCAALQSVWSFQPIDEIGTRAIGHFAVFELLTPFVRAWVVGAMAVGAAAGWFAWRDVAFLVLLLSFGDAMVSGAALLLRGSTTGAPDERALRRLLLAAPLAFLVSGATSALARGAGVYAFLKSTWTASAPA